MITIVESVYAKNAHHAAKRITTPTFDYFVPAEEHDNSTQRSRYRLLLQYGCQMCLNARERQVIDLHYRQGRRLTEIARETGIPTSTLSHRLRSARSKLFDFAEQAAAVQQIISLTDEEKRLS